MAEQTTTATVEVPSHGAEHAAAPSVTDISLQMIGLTWITFGLVAALLYKVAWKPILAGLEKREADIRKAVEDAQKARDELAKIEDSRARVIAEADAKAREIVDAARKGATDAAATIEAKAREQGQILIATAQREIQSAQEKAMAALRKESAELAISLSRKILRDNLDEDRSRKLADELISQV
jgi:F-type H+-transporting ATPase subunit b